MRYYFKTNGEINLKDFLQTLNRYHLCYFLDYEPFINTENLRIDRLFVDIDLSHCENEEKAKSLLVRKFNKMEAKVIGKF